MRFVLRLVLGFVLVIVLIGAPLLVVRHEQCRQGDRFEDVWSAAVPWQDERRPGCQEPESAAEELIEVIGGQ